MYKNRTALGISNNVPHSFKGLCEACELSKRKLQAIGKSTTRLQKEPPPYPWHSIYCDYIAVKPTSQQGNKGLFFFGCKLTDQTLPDPVPGKTALLSQFKKLVRKQEGLGEPIRHLYTDSENIFRTVSHGTFSRYLTRKGIRAHYSAPYRHEQSLAERPWQTIKRATTATMLHSRLPHKYWDYVMIAAAHTFDRLPSKCTGYTKSPYERATGKKPNVDHLVAIGMPAYIRKLPGEPRDRGHTETLRPNAYAGRVIGYPEDYKNAYLILQDDGSIKIRRDVVVETNPYTSIHIPSKRTGPSEHQVAGRTQQPAPPHTQHDAGREKPLQIAPRETARKTPVTTATIEPRQPSTRTRTPNVRNTDVTEKRGTHELTATPFTTAAIAQNASLWRDVFNNNNPADFNNRMPLPAVIPTCPKNLQTATRSDSPYYKIWSNSARKELRAILAHITPDTHDINRAAHLIRTFALLAKLKYKVDENTKELIAKTRIVLDGSRLIKGIHFTESYSPTISDRAFKTMIHVCKIKKMHFCSTDIGNAYLRAEADMPLRVTLPSYWKDANGKPIRCILNGNLYGKAQAGRLWYFTIDAFLISKGWTRSNFDPCIYYKNAGLSRMVTGLIVDDQLIGTNDMQLVLEYANELRIRFTEVTYVDNVKEIIGIGFKIEGPYVKLSLTKQIDQLTIDVPVDNRVTIPMSNSTRDAIKSAARGSKTMTHHDITGSIGYTADKIRYDVAYARSLLATYANDSTPADRKGILKCLQFLKNTSNRSLWLGGRDKRVIMFAFADGANELQSPNHGMLSYAIFLSTDSGAIVNKAVKSKNVAISSTDPEIRSIHAVMVEIIWHRAFLEEFGYPQREPTVIYTDSQPSIDICSSINTDGASKYLVRIINHIKQEIRRGEIQLKWVRTEDNPVDIGTKPLPFSLHDRHSKTLLTGFHRDTIVDGIRTKTPNV